MSVIPFAHDTVTLYNRRETLSTEGLKRPTITWHRTVLQGCYWSHKTICNMNNGSVQIGKYCICNIPESSNYVDPEAWTALEVSELGNYFTLYVGDLLVLGEVDDQVITEVAMRAKYAQRGVMTVKVVKNRCIPGFPIPHYHAEGV